MGYAQHVRQEIGDILLNRNIGLLTCVLCAAMIAGCTSSASDTPGSDLPTVDSVLTDLSPREGVVYYEAGVYAAQDTSVGVGILRYIAESDTLGAWVLANRETSMGLASEVTPFARLVGDPGFDSDFWPLDGQYVAAEGSVSVADRGVIDGDLYDISVEGLSRVSDIFPGDQPLWEPGLHYLSDGSPTVWGWTDETVNGVMTLLDRGPDADGEAQPIAVVMNAGKGAPRNMVYYSKCIVLENGPVPVVSPRGHSDWAAPPVGHSFENRTWRNVETLGVKDLVGGRHRIVGWLDADEDSGVAPGQVRVEPRPMALLRSEGPAPKSITLDDPDGLIDLNSFDAGSYYVGVEGVLSEDQERLVVDRFEVIPTPPSL